MLGVLVLLLTAHGASVLSIVLQRDTASLNIVVVEDLRVPVRTRSVYVLAPANKKKAHIMIFQVSTGRSASLKLQSNFSSETGSSVGS